MSTTSTPDLEATLRTRLLLFNRLSGDTLATILGTVSGSGSEGKLYRNQAPDNVTTSSPVRWGVMRLQNRRSSWDMPERDLAELEVMLFARPRSQQAALENAADACDEAMIRYTDATNGVIGCWGRMRSTLPVFAEPADRDVVQIRCVYTLVLWAANMTQYHDAA